MRTLFRCRLWMGIFAALPCWFAVVPLAGDEKPRPGFTRSLFDGHSLDGWTVENECKIGVEEGLLTLQDGNGWLRSDQRYGDFLLHVEWKALKETAYDAGIFIRTQPEGKPFPGNGHQINLLEGKEGNIPNLRGASSTGLVKRGEWNTFDATVIGDTVALKINDNPAYRVEGLKHATGYVGLQCEVPLGGRFQFRNLRITELRHRALFNGKDLAGWEGGDGPAAACWKVHEGLLICTGEKGPWLRSLEEFGDFNLRFDYQVAAGGNSGVYVRVPRDGNHHRDSADAPPAGFEVQILDDSFSEYKDLQNYQFSGGVYDIAGPTRKVSKAPGAWNSLEINCQGQKVVVTHNGIVIVEVDEVRHPLVKLRQTKGFLGLQNHSTQVKFRDIRIGPAS